MDEVLERQVRERAKHRCEYCRIPAYISEFTFPIDHIIAQQHGGETTRKTSPCPAPTITTTRDRTSRVSTR